MNTNYDKILEIIQINNKLVIENNKLLKDLHVRLNNMEKTDKKMDSHIDNIMNIYNGYKAPLDYITSYFSTPQNTLSDKTDKNKMIE